MLIKIPNKFIERRSYESCKERHIYINTDHIQAIQVETYDYGQGEEHHIQLMSVQGYITIGIATCVTKELKDEFIEWLEEGLRKAKQ